MTPVLKLNPVQMIGLACIGVVIGGWIRRRLPILDRLNIPTPIIGGMVFALGALALRDRVVNIEADGFLRDVLLFAFMTTVGLSARLELLRRGGIQMALLLGLSTAGAVVQNLVGIGLAKGLGIDPRMGILAGAVSLTGGPGTAGAFGGMFEKMGVANATAAAMACATFGISVAGLIGGYLGASLVRRRHLKPAPSKLPVGIDPEQDRSGTLLQTVVIVGVAMGLGNLLSMAMEARHWIMPGYIGSMIVAAVLRNLNDRFRFAPISQANVEQVGQVALYLFIVMALISLRLWELAHLALPLLVILAAQVVVCCLMCLGVFRVMGRDYDAAVTSSGFCGYMLGVTPNAVACMEEVVEKFGPAPTAFLIVPITGAFLIDFTNSIVITAMANWVR